MKDWLLHALGGVLIALACLFLPPAALAILVPLGLGWARESEQARGHTLYRPGAFWRWSSHRINEALAWPLGALLAVGLYALA
jgi:hypothetical protein